MDTITIQTDVSYGPKTVITVYNKPLETILADEMKKMTEWQKQTNDTQSTSKRETTFATIPATEFLYISPVGFTEKTIIISKDQNTTIHINTFAGSEFEQILSTWQF